MLNLNLNFIMLLFFLIHYKNILFFNIILINFGNDNPTSKFYNTIIFSNSLLEYFIPLSDINKFM